MKVKEYFKAQYNLRGEEENSKNFELLILDKMYGKKVDVIEWYDNLKTDYSTDGGIDFIIIDLDGRIIPLVEEDILSEQLENFLFEDSITDEEKENWTIDRILKEYLKKCNKKNSKLTIDFVQSKSGNSLQEKVLLKINNTFDDLLLKEDFTSVRYTEKLKNNIKIIKSLVESISQNDGAVEINFIYIANNDSVPKSIKANEELCAKISNNLKVGLKHNNVNVRLLYGQKLIEFLNGQNNSILSLKIDRHDMLFKNNLFCIGLVKLKDLEKFVSIGNNIDISLFEGNVRDCYKNSSSINREIKDTLKSEIKINDFWWLNNGITIICDSLSLKNGKLQVDSPQIVNGLQSVVTIFDTLKDGERKNENKKIMIRILVEKDRKNIDTIIKTTNTQNPVDDYLLKSTHEIHRDIENFFLSYENGYYYDRRKNYYKNVNKDKKRIFDIKYTFKTFSSIFLGIPSQVRTSTKTNFRNRYNEVFNENVNKAAYLYSDLLDRNIQFLLKKTIIDDDFKAQNGVSIVTYSLHLAYLYTALLKKTVFFTDKYISNSDIKNVEELQYDDKCLLKSIEILNNVVDESEVENKVYLARTKKFEEDLVNAVKVFLDKGEKDEN